MKATTPLLCRRAGRPPGLCTLGSNPSAPRAAWCGEEGGTLFCGRCACQGSAAGQRGARPKKSLSPESLRKAGIRALNPSQSQEPAKIFKLQVGLFAVARTKVTKSPAHLSAGSQGRGAEESARVGGTRPRGGCRVSCCMGIAFAITKPKGTTFEVGVL